MCVFVGLKQCVRDDVVIKQRKYKTPVCVFQSTGPRCSPAPGGQNKYCTNCFFFNSMNITVFDFVGLYTCKVVNKCSSISCTE